MEDNYLDNGELTFRKIGQKLKAAWLRIVVYVLVAAILVGACLGVVSILNKQTAYTSRVLFSNDGLTKEMTPWDSSLNISSDVKNVAVINRALTEIGVEGEEKDALTIKVMKNLVITPDFVTEVDKKEEVNKEANNFSFTIHLEDVKDLGLSDAKTQSLLDKIVEIYVQNFKSNYSYGTVLTAFGNANTAFNYLYATEVLETELNKAVNASNEMSKVAPNYREIDSKKTFNAIAIEFQGLKNEVSAIKAYLANTGVMKNPGKPNSEKDYVSQKLLVLDTREQTLGKEIEMLKLKTEELSKAGSGLVTPGGTSGSTVITIDPKEYVKLVDKLMEKQEALSSIIAHKNYLESVQNGYTPAKVPETNPEGKSVFELASEEEQKNMQTYVNEAIKKIVDRGDVLTQEMNACIDQFNKEANLKDAVKVTQTAARSDISGLSIGVIIAVEAIVVIIAFIVAMVVTNKKGQLALKKKAEAKDKDENKEN